MRELVLFVHIASAILLAGDLVFGSAWLGASLVAPDEARLTRYVQATLRSTGRRIAIPAMLVLLLSGLYLAHLSRLRWSEAVWLPISLALFLVVAGVWHGTLIPLRKKMERAVEEAGGAKSAGDSKPLGESYAKLARAWINVSAIDLALMAAILALMIVKPKL